MTTRWPSSCFGAVSSIHRIQNAGARLAFPRQQKQTIIRSVIILRGYASNKTDGATTAPEKAALLFATRSSKIEIDAINPPRSTLPPPLTLPKRDQQNVLMYYFQIGRSYGRFYWAGIKAVWFNHQAAKVLRERSQKTGAGRDKSSVQTVAMLRNLTRSEYQVLQRNDYDIGKLPLFGVLVMLFGEWLPVLVPFIPGAVPGTCRIPKQIHGMREKAEERRRISFRQGIAEPAADQLQPPTGSEALEWPMTQRAYAATMLTRLQSDQLYHLSSTLNLHNRLWDRIQLPPPTFLLQRGLAKHLSYLASDDLLLIRQGGASKLVPDELMIACEQRGIDVLGRPMDDVRKNLVWWLARQQDDRGKGFAIFTMLFRRLAIRDWVKLNVEANSVRRPNAWNPPSDK